MHVGVGKRTSERGEGGAKEKHEQVGNTKIRLRVFWGSFERRRERLQIKVRNVLTSCKNINKLMTVKEKKNNLKNILKML